jgi:excinuclease UvrABC nuclease subunit
MPDGQDEYQKIVRTIESFFKGNTKPIKDEIKSQIQDTIIKNNFERAAILRDIL